jgi:hypothetical protein
MAGMMACASGQWMNHGTHPVPKFVLQSEMMMAWCLVQNHVCFLILGAVKGSPQELVAEVQMRLTLVLEKYLGVRLAHSTYRILVGTGEWQQV